MSTPVGYVGPSYTVISQPTEAAVRAGIGVWLQDRTTAGMMRSDLVFDFTGTVKLTAPLLPAGTGQLQGVRWRGGRKRGTILQWASTDPILSARGQLRNFELSDLTFQSTVPNAGGIYLLSSVESSNQDGLFHRVEWMGPWNYGIGLNGPADANLNSEIVFDQCALSNDASFVNGWIWSGMGSGHAQEDQFVNYAIVNCKLEASHGPYLNFEKGGGIVAYGFNSWLHTGQSNPDKNGNPQPAGTMVILGPGPHADSAGAFRAIGVRAELRGPQSKLIDSAWGANAHIAWYGLDDTADAFKVKDVESSIYRGPAYVSYRDCGLTGWHHVTGTAPTRVVYDNCHSKAGNQFVATPLAGNGQLRYDTKAAPVIAVL